MPNHQLSKVKINIIANYGGSAWNMLMNLAFVPLYIKFLGIESYGLIGFFAALQAVLSILDMGLSATFSREMARLTVIPHSEQAMQNLVKTFSRIYWVIAIIVGMAFVCSAPLFAQHWLKSNISHETLQYAIMLMGIGMALRWPSNVYGGGLQGLQRQVTLNIINMCLATLRGFGAVFILWLISPTIIAFFIWQLVINLLQTLSYFVAVHHHIPKTLSPARFDVVLIKNLWKFATGMAAISVVATILTQMDKIVLSKLITLEQLGYYTLAGTIAYSLFGVVTPVASALFPRFSQLVAENNQLVLEKLYHQSCQLVSLLVIPAATVIAFFSKDIIMLWTHNVSIAEYSHTILSILIIGTTFNCLMQIPYQLQLAYKWTSLTFYMNLCEIIVLIPLLLFFTNKYGPIGAASIWVIVNGAYIVCEIPLMHRRLLKKEMLKWYTVDIAIPLGITLFVVGFFHLALPIPTHNFALATYILMVSAITLGITATFSPVTRDWFRIQFSAWRK